MSETPRTDALFAVELQIPTVRSLTEHARALERENAALRAALADERERCAKACEGWGDAKVKKWSGTEMETDAKARAWDALQCAAMIRALPAAPREEGQG